MDLQQILAAILNPNGSQQANQLAMAGAPAQQVGDHANPALLPGFAPQGAPPQAFAPPQVPQPQPMPPSAPQAAPMAAPAPSGGGVGGFLTNLLNPQAAGKNQTINWLKQQGMDEGTATMFASSKPALQQYLLTRSQGKKPIEIAGRLVDPTDFHVIADFSDKKDQQREIRSDANGVPRYTDNGAAVFPSDQNASGGTQFFSGKSIEAQGLNYLLDKNVLTKEQAANVAAGKQVTGPNGEIIFMTPQGIFQKPADGSAPQPVGGASGNIPITGPKYSEDMRKSLGFANRAAASDAVLADPNIAAAGASLGQNFKADIPLVGNAMVSNDYQKFDQAQRDFINAVLRRESGAAIAQSEFDNARKQYLPQYGDGPDVLKQKAENRRLAVQGLHQSADPVPSLTGSSMTPTEAPPAKGDDTPPASYTGKNWKYMTPEQRKLWQ